MKVLILSLIPIGLFLIGWAAGKRQRPELTGEQTKELVNLRATVRRLQFKAAEHATLGDDFAVIALGIIEEGVPDA